MQAFVLSKELPNLLRNFVLGGFIVASISFIGTFMSPLLGAIWWSFPLSLLPTLWFMRQHGKKNTYLGEFSLSTTYALALLVISTLSLYYFFTKEKGSFWTPIIKATAVWLICSIIFYFGIKYTGLENKFL